MADFGVGEALSAFMAGGNAVLSQTNQAPRHVGNILGPAGTNQLNPAPGYQAQSNPINLNSYLNNLQNSQNYNV